MTPLNQIANISVPEPRVIVIQPWDTSINKRYWKRYFSIWFGNNSINDGKIIRLVIPQLTEERRKELIKVVKKEIESSKVALRNIRRDWMKNLRKKKKQVN